MHISVHFKRKIIPSDNPKLREKQTNCQYERRNGVTRVTIPEIVNETLFSTIASTFGLSANHPTGR